MPSSFFYTIIGGCMGGIFIRSFFDIGMSGVLYALAVGCALFAAWKVRRGRTRSLLIISIACVGVALGAGRLAYEESKESLLAPHQGEEVSVVGRVVREPDVRDTIVHLYVRVEHDGRREVVLVTADRFESEVKFGDVIEARGTLKEPLPFLTDSGRSFDYPGYLRSKGVMMTMPFAEIHAVGSRTSFLALMFDGKEAFLRALERTLPEPSAGLGEGMLLGVRRALGDDLLRTFRETGIIHIVVLSGYNIMIVVTAIMHLLTYICFPRTRLWIGLITIVLFALLVGPSATVVRASLMAALILVAQVTGRTYAVLRALMLAAGVMLLHNPYLLVHDPGFQLSFIATLGLILLAPQAEERLTYITERLGFRSIVAATIATQVLVLPLLLYHTGLFSLVALPVNILVLPAVPVAMLLTFLTGLGGIVSSVLGSTFGFIAHLVLSYITSVPELFARLPFASVTLKEFPFWMMSLSYALLAICLVWLKQKEKDTDTFDLAEWTIDEETAPGAHLRTSVPLR